MNLHVNLIIKRIFDIFTCLILLPPTVIVGGGIAVLIKLDSKGPVLFKQNRVGRKGKAFEILKFRSMVVGAEQMEEGLFNYEGDRRVTRIGGFLRSTSLDELPQVINVLMGDMSLVGPRPPVSYELGPYEEYSDDLKRSFSVRPGITGYAQVQGRNELSWPEKTQFNLKYLDLFSKYGVMLDIYICILTLVKVFKNDGGFEKEENREMDEGLSKKK